LRSVREGRLQRLTLDRASRRNALDSSACHELVSALRSANEDPLVDLVLIDAEGKSFCSGMDLAEALEPDAARRTQIHTELFTAGYWMRKPLIASVQGGVVAGGVGLVANAHVVIAETTAWFSLPEVRIGMWPYVIWRALVDAMGERRARELTLTGRRFPASEARDYGLVHILAPEGELASCTAHWIRELSQASPGATQSGLEAAGEIRHLGFAEAALAAAARRATRFSDPGFRSAAANLLSRGK